MRVRISGALALVLLAVLATTSGRAQENPAPGDSKPGEAPATAQTPAEALAKLDGTRWTGKGVLWFGGKNQDDPHPFEGTLSIDKGVVTYTWAAGKKPQKGTLTLGEHGATWTDTWHQPKKVELTPIPEAWGLLALHYSYSAGGGPKWGWKIILSQKPTGELVLQMTNVCPWGEESRAWRLEVTKKS